MTAGTYSVGRWWWCNLQYCNYILRACQMMLFWERVSLASWHAYFLPVIYIQRFDSDKQRARPNYHITIQKQEAVHQIPREHRTSGMVLVFNWFFQVRPSVILIWPWENSHGWQSLSFKFLWNKTYIGRLLLNANMRWKWKLFKHEIEIETRCWKIIILFYFL